jgi:hypothetical protein
LPLPGHQTRLGEGRSTGRVYTFSADINPIGFTVLICGKGLVLVFAVLEVLHALGVVEDPVKPIQAAFGE